MLWLDIPIVASWQLERAPDEAVERSACGIRQATIEKPLSKQLLSRAGKPTFNRRRLVAGLANMTLSPPLSGTNPILATALECGVSSALRLRLGVAWIRRALRRMKAGIETGKVTQTAQIQFTKTGLPAAKAPLATQYFVQRQSCTRVSCWLRKYLNRKK